VLWLTIKNAAILDVEAKFGCDSDLVTKVPEGGVFVGNAALQGALAHAQLFGDHEEGGPAAGQ
jgi:hypothetical protein